MTRNDIIDRIGYAERELNWLRGLHPNCTNCDDFTKEAGFCKRHGGNPPPEFVQQGCEQWNFDDVPF